MFVTLKKIKLKYNLILFTLNFIFVFIIGLIPDSHWIAELYSLGVSGIFFASILSVTEKRIRNLYIAISLTILTWITTYLKLNVLEHLTSLVMLFFFMYIIVLLVVQISRSKKVGTLEFLKAINIYFLIGIMGAILFRTVYLANPHAISFNDGDRYHTTEFIYYSFTTMTTLGYGDITPISPLARSLAVFLSFGGQLYLAMIVALLVGKYLTQAGRTVVEVPVPPGDIPVETATKHPDDIKKGEDVKTSP